jgi:hypothetical protein
VRIGDVFIAAIYHPPKPQYRTELLLQYIDLCVETINNRYPGAQIIIAGDTNQLSENDIIERTGLMQIVKQPTRGSSLLICDVQHSAGNSYLLT